jgi:hypothetical protein
MKKLFLFIIVLLFFNNVLFAELIWKQVRKAVEYGFSICPLDSINCYLLVDNDASNTRILGTTNGGNTWKIRYDEGDGIPYPKYSECMSIPDKYHIYLGCTQAFIKMNHGNLKKDWDTIHLIDSITDYMKGYFVDHLIMFDSLYGIASFGNGIYLSNDGWKTYKLIYNHNASNLFMFSKKYFTFIMSYAFYYLTTDGGETWSSDSLIHNPYYPDTDKTHYIELHKTYFFNDSIGYMVGGASTGQNDAQADVIFKTIDSGKTWEQIYFQENESPFGLSDIAFKDSLNGVAVGAWGKILRTTNGGEYWFREFCETDPGKDGDFTTSFGVTMHVAYIGNNPIVIAGLEGIFKLMEDTTNSVSEPQIPNTELTLSPNPASYILYINGNTNNDIIKIYNITGIEQIETKSTNEIDISILPRGLYYAKIGSKFIKFIKL